jgi:5-hydroxyisourate hydrolase
MSKSKITSHILDTEMGKPASGVSITLEYLNGDTWGRVGSGSTDNDGRVLDWLDCDVPCGRYKISFNVEQYFQRHSRDSFYPNVSIEFYLKNSNEHYHVPLLLNAHGYSTYRGS